jgi:hypothetical protein
MKTLVIATFLSSATILLTLFVARTLWLLHEGHSVSRASEITCAVAIAIFIAFARWALRPGNPWMAPASEWNLIALGRARLQL